MCIAANAYGSTWKTVTLDGKSTLKCIVYISISNRYLCSQVQPVTSDMTIDIRPGHIVTMNSEISLNCIRYRSRWLHWSLPNRVRRVNNPLNINLTVDMINRRVVCHAKDNNGQWHRKIVRIQRYSANQFILLIKNSTDNRIVMEGHRLSNRSV
jgi:hypothetical protein